MGGSTRHQGQGRCKVTSGTEPRTTWDTRSSAHFLQPPRGRGVCDPGRVAEGQPRHCLFQPLRKMPPGQTAVAVQLGRVPQHSLRDSHALQESGCFRGKAKPLSIAASLMMGSFTTTQSLSWKAAEHQLQGRPPSRSGPSPTPCDQASARLESQTSREIPSPSASWGSRQPHRPLPRRSCSPARPRCPGDSRT